MQLHQRLRGGAARRQRERRRRLPRRRRRRRLHARHRVHQKPGRLPVCVSPRRAACCLAPACCACRACACRACACRMCVCGQTPPLRSHISASPHTMQANHQPPFHTPPPTPCMPPSTTTPTNTPTHRQRQRQVLQGPRRPARDGPAVGACTLLPPFFPTLPSSSLLCPPLRGWCPRHPAAAAATSHTHQNTHQHTQTHNNTQNNTSTHTNSPHQHTGLRRGLWPLLRLPH